MATTAGETEVGRVPLGHRPGLRYAAITSGFQGVRLSLHEHDPADSHKVWVQCCNPRGDYRPALLDVTQARALRDALNLFLADHDSQTADQA